MNRKSITFLSIVLVMTITMVAFGSNGTQIGTVGARSIGMGSAFRGLADDWSAVFFNPAGLTQFQSKWTIGGSIGLIMPRVSYTAHELGAAQIPFPGIDTKKHDATAQNFYVPSIGIFYKASEKLVFGLGVYAPFGLGTEWDIYHVPSAAEGWGGNQSPLSKEKEHYSHHQVINIQPTIAFKLSEKLSIGLGFSYISGAMDLRLIKLPIINPNPLMRGFSESYLEGTGTAMGANFGILIEASEKFSVGLSGRYCTDLKMDGTMETTIGTPLGNFTPAQLGIIAPEGDVTADLPLPMTLGGGIAFKPSPEMTITTDVSWTNWEKWDKIVVEGEGDAETAVDENWKNTIEIGAGLEYCVSEKLALRCGFYTTDTPSPNETMSPTIPDPSRRYVITGGFGFNTGKINFNLSGEYILFGEKDVKEYELNDALTPENYAGIYNFNAIVITLGTQINLN